MLDAHASSLPSDVHISILARRMDLNDEKVVEYSL